MVDETWTLCPDCGYKLRGKAICVGCGQALAAVATICPACGAMVAGRTAGMAAVVAAPQVKTRRPGFGVMAAGLIVIIIGLCSGVGLLAGLGVIVFLAGAVEALLHQG